MKEVIITYYIESSSKPSSRCRKDPIPSRLRPDQKTQQSFDRHAQLLSCAQELRHANDNQPSELKTSKKSRHKLQKVIIIIIITILM